ncbi:MAG: M48 family metalloprotease [Fimbriimonadaceae bacterium]|nr:M48 family metalloprotease [Fimbriimonadaceae bacterium]
MKRSFQDQVRIYRRRSIAMAFVAPFVAMGVFTSVGVWLLKDYFWALSALGLVIVLGVGAHGYFYAAPAMQISLANGKSSPEQERKLSNLRDELRVATGNTNLGVFLLDSPAIDAFALGERYGMPAIGVTEGALEACSRDELMCMLAFAAASLQMRDIRFLAMVWALAMLGPNMLRLFAEGWGQLVSDLEAFVPALVMLLIAVVLSIFGWVCAGWIYGLILSKRQKMADALALQLSRHPEAYISAMEKAARRPIIGIGGDVAPVAFVGSVKNGDMRRSVRRRINTIGRIFGVSKTVVWGG